MSIVELKTDSIQFIKSYNLRLIAVLGFSLLLCLLLFSFGLSRKGHICYDRSVCSPLDYIYNLDYNGINRVNKPPDISEFSEVLIHE